jgi:hypothetical protein
MDEAGTSMEDVGGLEDGMTTHDRMASSSLLDDSRALQFDVVGDRCGEEEQQVDQLSV